MKVGVVDASRNNSFIGILDSDIQDITDIDIDLIEKWIRDYDPHITIEDIVLHELVNSISFEKQVSYTINQV